jgi:Mg2+ and Co2+ transporter CorA
VDLESPTDEERGILDRVFGLHKLAIDHCLAQCNHPLINDYGDYFHLVVHGVSSPGAGPCKGSRGSASRKSTSSWARPSW